MTQALDLFSESPLARMERARQLLNEARSVDEIKTIRDQAEAARLYARQRDMGLESENYAAEIKVRAERRLGEVLAVMEKNRGAATPLQRVEASPPTMAELGLDNVEPSRFQRLAKIPQPEFEQHIEETKATGERLTTAGIVRLARQQEERDHAELVDQVIANADDGTVARARLRAAISRGFKEIGELFMLKPEAVAGVLNEGDWESLEFHAEQASSWFQAVLGARVTRLRAIEGERE